MAAGMADIPDRQAGDPLLSCFLKGLLKRQSHGRNADAAPTINSIEHRVNGGDASTAFRVHIAAFKLPRILQDTHDPVAFNAAQVAVNQVICNFCSDIIITAASGENTADRREGFGVGDLNPWAVQFKFRYLFRGCLIGPYRDILSAAY